MRPPKTKGRRKRIEVPAKAFEQFAYQERHCLLIPAQSGLSDLDQKPRAFLFARAIIRQKSRSKIEQTVCKIGKANGGNCNGFSGADDSKWDSESCQLAKNLYI
jgi:hypothetical protein